MQQIQTYKQNIFYAEFTQYKNTKEHGYKNTIYKNTTILPNTQYPKITKIQAIQKTIYNNTTYKIQMYKKYIIQKTKRNMNTK